MGRVRTGRRFVGSLFAPSSAIFNLGVADVALDRYGSVYLSLGHTNKILVLRPIGRLALRPIDDELQRPDITLQKNGLLEGLTAPTQTGSILFRFHLLLQGDEHRSEIADLLPQKFYV